MIIAVDGPAASGKGTLARRLARHYCLPHLDTGLLYRAVGLSVRRAGDDPASAPAAEAAAQTLDLAAFDDAELRTAAAGELASIVAAIPGVRAALLDYQRAFAAQPGGAVLDGRDIGTVVCPAATVKLFVTASPDVRAGRRHRELEAQGRMMPFDDVLADIRRRDERDRARSVAPMRPAEGARLLDTTDLDIEAAFQAALDIVESQKPRDVAAP
jgi:cytidylate kinase